MPQTNPRWLIEKAPGDLRAQVRIAVEHGYQVVQSDTYHGTAHTCESSSAASSRHGLSILLSRFHLSSRLSR